MLNLAQLEVLVMFNQPKEQEIIENYVKDTSSWSTIKKYKETLLDSSQDAQRINVTWYGNCVYGLKVDGEFKKPSKRKKIQAHFSLFEDLKYKHQFLDGEFMYAFKGKRVSSYDGMSTCLQICETKEVRGLYEKGVLRYFEIPQDNLKVTYNKYGKLQTIFYKEDSYTYEATLLDEENPVLTVTAPNTQKGITVLTIKDGKREYKELPASKKMYENPHFLKAVLKYGAIATAAVALFGAGRMTASSQIKTLPIQQHERG